MACDCSKYIDCGNNSTSVTSIDDTAGYSHNIDYQVSVSNLPISFLERTYRDFNVGYGWDRNNSVNYILVGCGSPEYQSCGQSKEAKSASSCRDYIVREVNTPYYLDRYNDIFVYKNQREELRFDITSTKTAQFKLKWGAGYFHKIIVKKDVRTKGTEKFVLVKNGVEQVLAIKEYEYNPFPATESGGATWGLYGNDITRTAIPDTKDVAMILLFPLVPKQAIPLDNDVIAYGFYDYNAIEGGFVECSLPKDDGGKDYFYPYWARQMPLDRLWRATADERYNAIYNIRTVNLNGTVPYYLPEINAYAYPFGSFAVDSKEAFVYSCLLQFSDRAGGDGIVVNYASFGDLYKAIYTNNKISAGNYHDYFPISPV